MHSCEELTNVAKLFAHNCHLGPGRFIWLRQLQADRPFSIVLQVSLFLKASDGPLEIRRGETGKDHLQFHCLNSRIDLEEYRELLQRGGSVVFNKLEMLTGP
jgi:hypothetical protein